MQDLDCEESLLTDPIRMHHLGHELAHPVHRKGVEAVITTPGRVAIIAGQSVAFHLASTLRLEGTERPKIPQFLTEHNSEEHLTLSRRCREKIRGRKVLVVGDHLAGRVEIKEVCDAVTELGATVVGVSIISAGFLDTKDLDIPRCIITVVKPSPQPGQTA
jgi:adenine/guanine phosphoribosyltransferase-like PRPP-binding protein